MDIISILETVDKYIFQLINRDLSASWLDGIMKLLRNPYTWIPLYAFILFWFYKHAGKKFFMIVLFSIITFALTDYLSAKVLKPTFKRSRPCYVTELNVRSVVDCGGAYSFPSSHASNHFVLATFWFLIIQGINHRKIYWLWLWALSICYAQVYVGVHYPADILFGAVFGTSIAFITTGFFQLLSQPNLFKKRNALSLHETY